VSYGSLKVLKDVNFITRRGDRIVIVGRNGAGKSSMLRCLAGTQKAQKGLVKFGANVTVGYFAQENEQLDFDKTVLGNLENATVVTEVQPSITARAFGLKGSAAHQMPATLSGGERAKLALAILASSDANLLLLDEPTNNLDPASVLALGDMMHKWKGTIVAVSHERGFVETLEPTHAVLLPRSTSTFGMTTTWSSSNSVSSLTRETPLLPVRCETKRQRVTVDPTTLGCPMRDGEPPRSEESIDESS